MHGPRDQQVKGQGHTVTKTVTEARFLVECPPFCVRVPLQPAWVCMSYDCCRFLVDDDAVNACYNDIQARAQRPRQRHISPRNLARRWFDAATAWCCTVPPAAPHRRRRALLLLLLMLATMTSSTWRGHTTAALFTTCPRPEWTLRHSVGRTKVYISASPTTRWAPSSVARRHYNSQVIPSLPGARVVLRPGCLSVSVSVCCAHSMGP